MYAHRLIKGIIYFGTALILAFNYHEIRESYWSFLIANEMSYDYLKLLDLFGLPVFIYFLKGCFFIYTCNLEKVPVYEASLRDMMTGGPDPADSNLNNIEKIKAYRDSLLSTMENSKAAEEYKKTAWLDGLANANGRETSRTIKYINSRLAAKTNKDGYEWLKK